MRISENLPRSLKFDRSFFIRNFAAWLTFCVIMMVLNVMLHDRPMDEELKSDMRFFFCCMLGTHLLRMFIQSAGETASWRSVYVHAFLVGIPVCSLLMTVLSLELFAFFQLKSVDQRFELPRAFFGLWFFKAVLFGGWAGVYVSSLALKRSNKAEVSRLEAEKALREAELRVLKAQINPHFLFNSLNTIRALVNEHPDRAQEAVLHLSLLLRAALQSESMLRPLREELGTVRHYLELEKLRFEERLSVHINIPAGMMDVPVPTMLVQILAENAVKHGIATMVNGGLLSITGFIDGDTCSIVVANPGTLKGAAGGNGLGLLNARTRLDRLVGPSSSIELAEKDGIVTATIQMPYRRITV